jgi:hypothetical protein
MVPSKMVKRIVSSVENKVGTTTHKPESQGLGTGYPKNKLSGSRSGRIVWIAPYPEKSMRTPKAMIAD